MKLFSVCLDKEGTYVSCEEAPWYIHLINEIAMGACCWTLFKWKGKKYSMHDIPLPNWPKIFYIFNDDPEDERYSPSEMYGDLGAMIGQWLMDSTQWAWTRTERWNVPVPYELLKPHLDEETKRWIEEALAERENKKDEEVIP